MNQVNKVKNGFQVGPPFLYRGGYPPPTGWAGKGFQEWF